MAMAEKEYIEREAAIDATYALHFKDSIQEALRNLPAADVRPAVRGAWVKARGSWWTPGGDPVWECSECGKGRHVYGIEHGSYGDDVADGQWVACPNCGAEMGGDER